MRVFIAIKLPAEIIQELSNISAASRPKITTGVRWVPPKNIHLTLRFLGESSMDQVQRIKETLSRITDLPAFDLTPTQYGVFPAWKSPTTIWLGIEQTNDLLNLQRTVETIAQNASFNPERKVYRPHLTLARVKRNPSLATVKQVRDTFELTTPTMTTPFQVYHVVLFQSILRPQGAFYHALHTVELQR